MGLAGSHGSTGDRLGKAGNNLKVFAGSFLLSFFVSLRKLHRGSSTLIESPKRLWLWTADIWLLLDVDMEEAVLLLLVVLVVVWLFMMDRSGRDWRRRT
jgi:hypothetical protein